MAGQPTPARRTALLGLLAELQGAGAQFHDARGFLTAATSYLRLAPRARIGVPAPHGVGVLIDRRPDRAVPFARASAAMGIKATFLLRHDPGRVAHGPQDPAIAELARLGHSLALHVDLANARDDPEAFGEHLTAVTRAFDKARAPLSALSARRNGGDPLDVGPLAAGVPEVAQTTRGAVPDWVGWVGAMEAGAVHAQVGVIDDHQVLRAASLDPFYEIHASPRGVIDALTVACLVDTAARAVCWHELRLSSLI